PYVWSLFFFHHPRTPPYLHSFPTRRSSDLVFPDVPGLKEAKPWTSREVTSTSVLPEHLVIMGGGVVGCEMATAYSSFGAQVTLVDRKSTRLNSSHSQISYAVFCLKKKIIYT